MQHCRRTVGRKSSLREGVSSLTTRSFIEQCDVIPFKLEGVQRLTDALGIIEASGLKDEAMNVLEALGYTSVWEGMEIDKVRIVKSRSGNYGVID